MVADIGRIREIRSSLRILEEQLNTLDTLVRDNILPMLGLSIRLKPDAGRVEGLP